MRRDLEVAPNAIDAFWCYDYEGVDLAALVEYGGVVDGDLAFARPHLEEVSPIGLVPRRRKHLKLMRVGLRFEFVVDHLS